MLNTANYFYLKYQLINIIPGHLGFKGIQNNAFIVGNI